MTDKHALIIQPGAIGDCILTLPLAQYIKDSLGLNAVTFWGHLEYIGIFEGRSCIDSVKSIESVKLHRFFQSRSEFDLEDADPLLAAFAPYGRITTFQGDQDSDFEHNLIYTAHCTHSAEITTLRLKPTEGLETHISRYYIEQFAEAHAMQPCSASSPIDKQLIIASETDKLKGTELLKKFDIDAVSQRTVVISPGSGSAQKCHPIENYMELAKQLKAKDFRVIFLLGPAEIERLPSSVIGMLDQTAPTVSGFSMEKVLQLLSVSYGFVGNDSGISHLAGGLGIRTVVLFCTTKKEVYKPCGPNVTALQIPPDDFFAVFGMID